MITASARRNPAAAVARSERESASWESGNLGSCRAFADSPRCQDSRFSVPRDSGNLGGRNRRAGERARAGAGGNLANWKSGILRTCAARRGAGRPGPRVPRSARVKRTRAAAMASPMLHRSFVGRDAPRSHVAARRDNRYVSDYGPHGNYVAKTRCGCSNTRSILRGILCSEYLYF